MHQNPQFTKKFQDSIRQINNVMIITYKPTSNFESVFKIPAKHQAVFESIIKPLLINSPKRIQIITQDDEFKSLKNGWLDTMYDNDNNNNSNINDYKEDDCNDEKKIDDDDTSDNNNNNNNNSNKHTILSKSYQIMVYLYYILAHIQIKYICIYYIIISIISLHT